jgi:elongation factor Ts
MDCKKALSDPLVGEDLTKAIAWLRKKGVAKATSSYPDKIISEGIIGKQHFFPLLLFFLNWQSFLSSFIHSLTPSFTLGVKKNKNNKKLSLVEVNSETDFVARNENFKFFVSQVTHAVDKHYSTSTSISIPGLLSQSISDDVETTISIQESLGDLISRIKYNKYKIVVDDI